MSDASVPVFVYRIIADDSPQAAVNGGRTHVAFVATNHKIVANGTSRDDALKRLKREILRYISTDFPETIEMVDMQFDELIVQQIHNR